MGNASAREVGNGHAAASLEQVPLGGGSTAVAVAPPDAVMRELPPPVPYVFAPQVMNFEARNGNKMEILIWSSSYIVLFFCERKKKSRSWLVCIARACRSC